MATRPIAHQYREGKVQQNSAKRVKQYVTSLSGNGQASQNTGRGSHAALVPAVPDWVPVGGACDCTCVQPRPPLTVLRASGLPCRGSPWAGAFLHIADGRVPPRVSRWAVLLSGACLPVLKHGPRSAVRTQAFR